MLQFRKRELNWYYVIIFMIIALLLVGCTSKEQSKPNIPVNNEKPKTSVEAANGELKLPISIPAGEGEFYKVAGWVSDTQILYITNQGQASNVYRYNLMSGKSELIFKSDAPIVTVKISPSRRFFLIHSSPSSYEGLITIIDEKGEIKQKESLASYELAFEWNPYDENQVLVTKFNEDWTFQLLLLNMKNSSLTEVSYPQPFIKWMDEKRIAFLNWNENNPAFFAPLVVRGLENGMEKSLFPTVLQFSTYKNLLMTVTVNEQDQTKANYVFFDKDINKIFSFSLPQLSKFSDWLVPFYDYNETTGQFITFSPLRSGEADSYMDGFELISYNLTKGSTNLIMDGLDNEPLSFSPSGEAVLYGNSFEKLIHLTTKKIDQLIKE